MQSAMRAVARAASISRAPAYSTLAVAAAAAPARPAASAALLATRRWQPQVFRRDYNVNGNEVKTGSTIKWEDKTWLVLSTTVNMRGRAHTTYNIDLKDVSSSSKISIKVRPADKIEVIEMTTVRMNYLYRQGSSLFFMDPVSFEQVELDVSLLPRGEKAAGYLIENSSIVLKKNDDAYVSIHVPEKVVCTVLDTPSGRTKQVNDTGGKEAKLTNGLTIMLPNFIENGTHIIVNTETDAYVGKSEVPPAPEVEMKY